MEKNSPTTLRWFITNKWGDPASHAAALRLIDDIVGFPAPGGNHSTPDAVGNGGNPGAGSAAEEGGPVSPANPGGASTSPVRKIALVIGHNSTAKGAYADAPVAKFEYDFNNSVASEMISMAPERGLECRRFLRTAGGGYNVEIDRVYREVDAFAPDLIVEMHFNGGGGDYATMLHAKGSGLSALAARAMLDEFSSRLGIRAWGLMDVTRDGRGGRSVWASARPTVLTEPFFGDRPEHVKRVNEFGVAGLASVYLAAIAAALKAIGK
jgi:hypothetical protein